MKKAFISSLIMSFTCIACYAQHPRITQLIAEKQAKMAKLEKCQGTTKNLKIAGISTLGITAVGIGANIAEAVVLNNAKEDVAKAQKARDEQQTIKDEREAAEKKRQEEERKRQECDSRNAVYVNGVCGGCKDGYIADTSGNCVEKPKPDEQQGDGDKQEDKKSGENENVKPSAPKKVPAQESVIDVDFDQIVKYSQLKTGITNKIKTDYECEGNTDPEWVFGFTWKTTCGGKTYNIAFRGVDCEIQGREFQDGKCIENADLPKNECEQYGTMQGNICVWAETVEIGDEDIKRHIFDTLKNDYGFTNVSEQSKSETAYIFSAKTPEKNVLLTLQFNVKCQNEKQKVDTNSNNCVDADKVTAKPADSKPKAVAGDFVETLCKNNGGTFKKDALVCYLKVDSASKYNKIFNQLKDNNFRCIEGERTSCNDDKHVVDIDRNGDPEVFGYICREGGWPYDAGRKTCYVGGDVNTPEEPTTAQDVLSKHRDAEFNSRGCSSEFEITDTYTAIKCNNGFSLAYSYKNLTCGENEVLRGKECVECPDDERVEDGECQPVRCKDSVYTVVKNHGCYWKAGEFTITDLEDGRFKDKSEAREWINKWFTEVRDQRSDMGTKFDCKVTEANYVIGKDVVECSLGNTTFEFKIQNISGASVGDKL